MGKIDAIYSQVGVLLATSMCVQVTSARIFHFGSWFYHFVGMNTRWLGRCLLLWLKIAGNTDARVCGEKCGSSRQFVICWSISFRRSLSFTFRFFFGGVKIFINHFPLRVLPLRFASSYRKAKKFSLCVDWPRKKWRGFSKHLMILSLLTSFLSWVQAISKVIDGNDPFSEDESNPQS